MQILIHAALFAGLAIMVLALFRKSPVNSLTAPASLLVIIVGVFQEGLQAAIAGVLPLGGIAFDLGVDLAGGMIGLGSAWIAAWRKP